VAGPPVNGKRRRDSTLANCKLRKVDAAKTKELRERGLSITDIAKHQGVNPSTVWRFLRQLDEEKANLEAFKGHRADALAHLQGKALRVQHLALDSMERDLSEDAITHALKPSTKKMYSDAATMSLGVSYDKERLERGESTSNISVVSRMVDSSVSSLYKRKPLGVRSTAEAQPPGEPA
jgi:transposase-like protein